MKGKYISAEGPSEPKATHTIEETALEDQNQEFLKKPPIFGESSAHLLEGYPVTINTNTEAQQTNTTAGQDSKPPRTCCNKIHIVLLSCSFLVFFTIPVITLTFKLDPLEGTYGVLAHLATIGCTLLIGILALAIGLSRKADIRTDPNRAEVQVFLYAMIWLWSLWLTIYGVILMWDSSPMPSSHTTLAHMKRVWVDFQAKITAPDALTRLTICLQDSVPDRNATITDFTTCLESIYRNDASTR